MFDECKLEGDFTLNSGKKSNVFYDFDLLSPQAFLEYADKLCDKIKASGLKFDFVVAPAIGGIVLGWLVAGEAGVPLLIVDKEGQIRGKLPPEGDKRKYLIVDDVISTYGTMKRVAEHGWFAGTCRCVGLAAFIFRGKKMLKNTLVLEHKEIET